MSTTDPTKDTIGAIMAGTSAGMVSPGVEGPIGQDGLDEEPIGPGGVGESLGDDEPQHHHSGGSEGEDISGKVIN